MSKLYVTANTDAIRTLRTARGHHWVKAAVQSWSGSVQVAMDEHGNISIYACPTSSANPPDLLWSGTLMELYDRLTPKS